MIKMISLTCPKCKSNLEVDAERKECFCQYCGAKLLIDNGEIVNVFRDEAKIMEVELHEKMWKEELAQKERDRQEKAKKKKQRIWGYIIWFLITVLIAVIPLVLEGLGIVIDSSTGLLFVMFFILSLVLEVLLILSRHI